MSGVRVTSILATGKILVGWALSFTLVGVTYALRATGPPQIIIFGCVCLDSWALTLTLLSGRNTFRATGPVVVLVLSAVVSTSLCTAEEELVPTCSIARLAGVVALRSACLVFGFV